MQKGQREQASQGHHRDVHKAPDTERLTLICCSWSALASWLAWSSWIFSLASCHFLLKEKYITYRNRYVARPTILLSLRPAPAQTHAHSLPPQGSGPRLRHRPPPTHSTAQVPQGPRPQPLRAVSAASGCSSRRVHSEPRSPARSSPAVAPPALTCLQRLPALVQLQQGPTQE